MNNTITTVRDGGVFKLENYIYNMIRKNTEKLILTNQYQQVC